MKKAALYIRVSTHHQIDKDSLPMQRKALIMYCDLLKIDDYEVFVDAGYSGSNTVRPAYQEMMERIRNKEFTHLIVYKIDRISRNLLDFAKMYEELKDYNVDFISRNEQFDTSSAMGEAMLKIILIFAELERKLTAERVYATMLSRAEKGLWNGANVPIGYQYSEEEKYPVVDEEEAKTVQFIFDMYEKYQSSGLVVRELEKAQMKTKRGGQWTTKTVLDVLDNQFYKGTYTYNMTEGARGKKKPEEEWIVIEDNHEAIISKEQFDRCAEIRKSNVGHLKSNQRRSTYTHIFSGLLYCPKCDKNYIASADRPRVDGYRPSRYRCYTYVHNRSSCTNMIGEVQLGPIIHRYIFNMFNVVNLVNENKISKISDIEKLLLYGDELRDIKSIVHEDIEQIPNIIKGSINEVDDIDEISEVQKINVEYENGKKRINRALQRLEELYLFGEDGISSKDFILRKKELNSQLEELENLYEKEYEDKKIMYSGDLQFIQKATEFLIIDGIINESSNYNEVIKVVDKKIIQDYMNTIIKRITIDNKRIVAIEFANGMEHRFLY